MRCLMIVIAAAAVATPALAAGEPVSVTTARASLAGRWAGQLEYLDYSANKWFGIPVTTTVEDQGDGATIIRKSEFDDGPTVGTVRITTVDLFDAAKGSVTSGTFRKGRVADLTTYTVRIATPAADATHWTMVEEAKAKDDDRPATLRLTTVRNGDLLETLKEVDFLDDTKSAWLRRNRLTLRRLK